MNNLIIFTRYPEAGKTKTRLIPILGKDGAASLHKQMLQHTFLQAKKLQQITPVAIEIHFTGGNENLMQKCLGNQVIYRQQQGQDLGERMSLSFQGSFTAKMNRVVIIGSDCPELNYLILAEAFTELQNHDLVLGPARDGGYYLIGLNSLFRELFIDINWGTNEVLNQTLFKTKTLGLKYHLLPILADIDIPENLVIWEKYRNHG